MRYQSCQLTCQISLPGYFNGKAYNVRLKTNSFYSSILNILFVYWIYATYMIHLLIPAIDCNIYIFEIYIWIRLFYLGKYKNNTYIYTKNLKIFPFIWQLRPCDNFWPKSACYSVFNTTYAWYVAITVPYQV